MPDIQLVTHPGWGWNRKCRTGDIIEEIVSESRRAELIVMATAGHQNLLDTFRGSTTEQVLRQASCPLLAIPAVQEAPSLRRIFLYFNSTIVTPSPPSARSPALKAET